jgi:hypothetical protein
MGRNEIVERLKTQRDSARMKLRDAQGEASGIIAAANRAIADEPMTRTYRNISAQSKIRPRSFSRN